MLEPDGVKVACPVLRGLGAGNGLRLLDINKYVSHITSELVGRKKEEILFSRP